MFGLFRDDGENRDADAIVYDHDLLPRIAAYIQHSAEQMERINHHLADKLRDVERVMVWGAGQFAMKLLALSCLANTKVCAFVDNNPVLRGKTLGRAPIVGPQQIAGSREPIVIATLLHAGEIEAQIRRLGLSNPIISLLPKSQVALRREVSAGARHW